MNNIYRIDDKTFAVIDGELFQKLESVGGGIAITADSPAEAPKKRGRQKGFKLAKKSVAKESMGPGRGHGKRLSQDVKDVVMDEIRRGQKSAAQIKGEYGISNNIFYKLKNLVTEDLEVLDQANASLVDDSKSVKKYKCVFNHVFTSQEDFENAICTQAHCGKKAFIQL